RCRCAGPRCVRAPAKPPLRRGQRPGLALQLAQCATAVVGLRAAHPLLELTNLVERATATLARLTRILPAQIARGVLHLRRRLPQRAAVFRVLLLLLLRLVAPL